MPNFITGIFVAFLEPVLHAWSNILDNHFSNNVFPKLPVLLFFGTVLNIIFLPLVFLFDPPATFPINLFGFVLLIALIDVLYLFPYYWALREADTSVVVSLAALGKVFVPILAFFFIGEELSLMQYVGFGLIVLSAALLTLDIRRFRVNRSFFLMLAVSFVIAVQTILYKLVFDGGATWGGVVGALTGLEVLIAGAIMFLTTRLSSIRDDFRTITRNWKLFAAQQGFEWGGNMSNSLAISLLPVSVAQGITSTQPFFVLAYAFIFRRFLPDFFNEVLDGKELGKKLVLFLLSIVGTILIVFNGQTF